MSIHRPVELDLKKDRGLTVRWNDGTGSFYSIALLRRMSPSADMRELRDEMASNPLAVLPNAANDSGSIVATDAELVGNYAIRIMFSDGHRTGLYTWDYLRQLDEQAPGGPGRAFAPGTPPSTAERPIERPVDRPVDKQIDQSVQRDTPSEFGADQDRGG
jgi:DUF971 family protein